MSEWLSLCTTNKNGDVLGIPSNLAIILRYHEAWQGLLRYNLMTGTPELTGSPPGLGWKHEPGPWSDELVTHVTCWLSTACSCRAASKLVDAAMREVARRTEYHAFRDDVERVDWDHVPRAAAMLPTYLQSADNEYTRGFGLRWGVSIMARAYNPGCQADLMLILRGKQGVGKSTFFRILGGQFHVETQIELGNKDIYQILQGAAIVEFSELASMRAGKVEVFKQFITETSSTFRAPYARNPVTVKRSCVFCGTMNSKEAYMIDPTGSRRLIDVEVGELRTEEFQRDRPQILAELKYLYDQGQAWHTDSKELKEMAEAQQSAMTVSDIWSGILHRYITDPTRLSNFAKQGVTTEEVATLGIGIERARLTNADQRRIAEVLHRLGWSSKRESRGGLRQVYYYPPGTTEELFPIGPE